MSLENLTKNSLGDNVLTLKGEWTKETDSLLSNYHWDKLVLFGVEWKDYQQLIPYKEKIKWLSVPLGPELSKGIEKLVFLEKIELGDRILPAVDFSVFDNLNSLVLNIDKRFPTHFLNSQSLKKLTIDGFPDKNFLKLDSLQNLTSLEIKRGSLNSLIGIEKLSSLKTLRLVRLRMLSNISDITKASAVENITINNVSKLEDISVIFMLKKLKKLEVSGNKIVLKDTELVTTIKLIEYLHLYFEIDFVNWKNFISLRHLKSLSVTSKQETLKNEEIKAIFEKNGMKIDSFDKLELANAYNIEFKK